LSPIIINPGGEGDVLSIPLVTRRLTRIPNERRPRAAPLRMRSALEIIRKQFPPERVELRALDASYNCVGLVFAGRRTCIEPEHVEMILEQDDDERRTSLDRAAPGDIAVYRDEGREVCHVGIVATVHPDLSGGPTRIRILSQWGSDGEYLHDADAVPHWLGRLTEVWTYRYGAP
jgi:hypothetical protein